MIAGSRSWCRCAVNGDGVAAVGTPSLAKNEQTDESRYRPDHRGDDLGVAFVLEHAQRQRSFLLGDAGVASSADLGPLADVQVPFREWQHDVFLEREVIDQVELEFVEHGGQAITVRGLEPGGESCQEHGGFLVESGDRGMLILHQIDDRHHGLLGAGAKERPHQFVLEFVVVVQESEQQVEVSRDDLGSVWIRADQAPDQCRSEQELATERSVHDHGRKGVVQCRDGVREIRFEPPGTLGRNGGGVAGRLGGDGHRSESSVGSPGRRPSSSTVKHAQRRRSEKPDSGPLIRLTELLKKCFAEAQPCAAGGTTLTNVLDAELSDHLRGGVTVVVATVDANGVPIASKGYGAVPVDEFILWVFVSANDPGLTEHLRPQAPLAVTSGNVFSFKSVQFKGIVESLSPSTVREQELVAGHMRRLNDRIGQLQNVEPEHFERRMPSAFLTCTMRVTDIFDQSPGPSAGRIMAGPTP